MNAPDVTIVVCTYNRADRLPAALESLGALVLGERSAEILVVDNNSTDDTAAVVDRIAATSAVPVRRVLETTQGIVPARNRGIAEARGEWIAFFDDDQLAEPDWITELFRLAERRGVECVGGAVVLSLPEGAGPVDGMSPVVRMLLGETVGEDREREYTQRFTPGCGNLMIRHDVFDRIGTFDPAMVSRGEDTDLWMRMHTAGMKGWFTPRAVIHHVIPPERLDPAFLLRLSSLMAEGMAADERTEWGWRYPLVWLARLGQYLGVLWPRRIWATLSRNRPRVLGARCRLRIAGLALVDGLRLMARTRTTKTTPPHPVPPASGGRLGTSTPEPTT